MGFNECRSTSWWRELFEQLAVDPWRKRVAVVITCLSELWWRHFASLYHIQTTSWVLPGHDESELNRALAYHLRRDEIAEDVLPLPKEPRYFGLMVKHRRQMEESGDITVARLIYEDWCDRLKRKNLLNDLDNETFQRLICDLAQKSRDGARTLSDQDVHTLVPLLNDRESLLRELSTGGVLQQTRAGFHVNEHLLICGFGLLLADQVEQAMREGKPLDETTSIWLEPHAGMDVKTAICGAAVVHALSVGDFPPAGRVVLLLVWLMSQNPGSTIENDFAAYVPLSPERYVDLAEILWSDTYRSARARDVLLSALLRWTNSPHIVQTMRDACERWLGFVHPCGFSFQYGADEKNVEEVKTQIAQRVGRPLVVGPLLFGKYSLTVIESKGLLYLGHAAITLIFHLPRGPFIHAIAIGCVAEAVMDMLEKYDLFSWVLHSTPR